ncbi:MAG TPA: putative DNA modification/repair radical SAM protein [Pyrinomonadaceae bacterium]|nr:putative DNA modification/repair radical SAM protein [Pyrinomonadaceae bacterium]
MELRRKLAILADAAKYDASCASSGSKRKRDIKGIGNTEGMGICHSYTPDGRCISLLKLLLTNVCIWDCSYCVNRRSSDVQRARFKPDEVVRLTMDFYKRNYIEGLFLSSGIIQNADYTMEQLVLVAKTLREQELFGGYIHLKAVPGASKELLLEAGKYADRLSANIEMPVQEDLDQLAPEKTIGEIEHTMADVKQGIDDAKDLAKRDGSKPVFAAAGQSTQLVVGASASSDTVILSKAEQLYNRFKLRRVYYSAFSPAEFTDTELQTKPKTPPMREHRLYEADWLIRNYGFSAHEVTSGTDDGNLDLHKDPKLSWALRHRQLFPVDVNRASKSLLLRIPGIGVRNVQRILNIRRFHRIRLEDLARLNVTLARAKWFITTADHNPDVFRLDRGDLPDVFKPRAVQQSLFEIAPRASVVMGEL